MNTFQCLVLVVAIGFIITTVSAKDRCFTDPECKAGTNTTSVSCSDIHHTTPS